MKRAFTIGAVLLFLASAAGAEITVETFIEQIGKGDVPSQFPPLNERCETPGLAQAFAAFAKAHPQKLPGLLAVVKQGFSTNDCPKTFENFATQVRNELRDPYDLLDDLARPADTGPETVPGVIPPLKLDKDERQEIARATIGALDTRFLIALAVVGAFALAILVLLLIQIRLQKLEKRNLLDGVANIEKSLNGVLVSMRTSAESHTALNVRSEMLLGGFESWFQQLPNSILSTQDLSAIAASIEGVRRELSRVGPPEAVGGHAPAIDTVALEREALHESWHQFHKRKDLVGVLEHASRDEVWRKIQNALLFELPQYIPDDLKPTFDSVVARARDYHNLAAKISLVPRIVNDELPRLEPGREMRRTRELANLLDDMQNSGEAAERLNFRVKSWITDTFLGFADLYLQRYQQAQLENHPELLQKGAGIVREVLLAAAVAPIDVTPGKTTFDSTRHVGRSTANDPRFGDGVIVGVIRNGFTEGGQQVMRQPEVIVNRTR